MLITVRFRGPSDADLAMGISGGVVGGDPEPAVYKLIEVENAGEVGDVKASAADRQWVFVGNDDVRPAALESWTPPNTSSTYSGVSILGVGVPTIAEANDMREKLGLAVARIEALTALLAARGITAGS